jgi:predicted ABC-type transport system involved in lysophospholipase L1 biosynthesis ATPase subunit
MPRQHRHLRALAQELMLGLGLGHRFARAPDQLSDW